MLPLSAPEGRLLFQARPVPCLMPPTPGPSSLSSLGHSQDRTQTCRSTAKSSGVLVFRAAEDSGRVRETGRGGRGVLLALRRSQTQPRPYNLSDTEPSASYVS